MNKLEKFVYDRLKHTPAIKLAVRNMYQRLMDLLPQPKAQSAYTITDRPGYFFGFHDHTPFSADNTKLLANRFTIPLRMPKLGETLEVGYFDGPNYETYHPVAETRAWLWHMGCKLQWRGDTSEIVFNDHQDGQNIARMIDVTSGRAETLPDSIGSVSPDGKWAVGYSFARVAECMPGYGYHYDIGDPEKGVSAPRENGIHLIDLNTKQRKLLFSVADLVEIQPEPSMQGARHFVTHTVFSPDSKRFIFLHRWIHGDVRKRWSRMISSDLEGRDLHVFPTIDMVSHIGWRDAHHVIAYSRIEKFDDQYVLFKDRERDNYQVLGHGKLVSDGHPSFEPSGRWFVTDTYPDRRRVQTLILFDTFNDLRYDIARLPSPAHYQSRSPLEHWSCDLHPRWDREGRRLCFDSTFTGIRSLCTIDLGLEFKADQLRYLSRR